MDVFKKYILKNGKLQKSKFYLYIESFIYAPLILKPLAFLTLLQSLVKAILDIS